MQLLSRRAWPWIGTTGLALLGGCALVYNFDDYTASSGAGGASSSGTETGTSGSTANGGSSASDASSSGAGGSAGCSVGSTCVDVPSGWMPFSYQSGNNLACPAGFIEKT